MTSPPALPLRARPPVLLAQLLVVPLLAPSAAASGAQESEVVWGPWMVLAPIHNPGGPNGVRDELDPEKDLGRLGFGKLGPRFEVAWEGKGGAAVEWQRAAVQATSEHPTGDEAVHDLTAGLEPAHCESAAAYLYREIEAEADVLVPVAFGADDGFTVWLNGERLLAQDGARGLTTAEFSAALALRDGRNHLLVKVVNGGGAWAFQMLRDATSLAKAKASLEREVDRAIDRGVDYLLSTQYPDGSWAYHTYPYRNGQTALSLYALLKSGLPPTHPACRRALEYLRARPPVRTYSAACHLMALEALHDEELLPDVEVVAELLLEWREGGYGYPQPHIDLSNTQYGALGLRAAARAGVRVRDREWIELVEHTLGYQQDDGGFAYLPTGASTGSMTAAGLTVFGLAREALGDRGLPARLEAEVERSTGRALDWLAARWDVGVNPAPDAGAQRRWHPYYLYGLERVGGLLGLERIRGFDWYADGARRLVAMQGPEGQWGTAYGEPEPNTAFALLFLERATAVVSGDRTRARRASSWGDDDPAQPFSLRASGEGPVAVWISSWGDATTAAHTWPREAGGGLRVRTVEYLLDGEVVATVSGDPDEPAGLQRFPTRLQDVPPGAHTLGARITLAKPPPDSADVVLEAPPLELELAERIDPATVTYGRDAAESLLRDAAFELTASSVFGDAYAAARAVDGRLSTSWLSANDAGPQHLTLDLDRALRADTLLLSHAYPHVREPRHAARATKVLVVVNGNERRALEVTLDPDVTRKTAVDLGRRTTIRELELRVLERAPGERQPHAVGFAEVELLERGS